MKFVDGRIKSFEFGRRQKEADTITKNSFGKNTFEMRFSFDDAQQVAGGITRSFQSYWQSECDTMKTALVSMDTHHTGRVPLSKFYNTAINTDWRFGESEAYLRELGALDDTSSWRGPQVIIPNYLLAASNCIVASTYYLVCCVNECESLLQSVEDRIQSPVATVEELLPVVESLL